MQIQSIDIAISLAACPHMYVIFFHKQAGAVATSWDVVT